ncbi:ferredoxin-NADP+ reductase subunit alpha [Clostridia bacterium]|nr:ferredoxin-NADP+ reductase subunit alpha [Clostridia bacterium]
MFEIISKKQLNSDVYAMEIHAPRVAKKAQAGQFIMLRVSDMGERIPLTVAGFDRNEGSVRIIFQAIGKTTTCLSEMNEGDCLVDFVGPLGMPTELPNKGKVVLIGGGLGAAISLPQAEELYRRGVDTHAILGFRNKDLIILEDEFRAATHGLKITTDDGSNGRKGFVTDILREKIEGGAGYDLVIAIGPLPMMRAVCNLTRVFGVKTIISMNSTMVDGTGMCGCCRVSVGGEVKFACVDGPDFDGHQVDFDEAMRRSRMYSIEEKQALDQHALRAHKCRLGELA